MVNRKKIKKILFVITKSNWGGAQRYVYNLAVAAKENFEVVVAFGGSGEKDAKEGLFAQKLREHEIRTIFVKSFMRDISFVRELKAFFELLKLFRFEKPDVIHLNSSKAGGIGSLAARLTGTPNIIFTSHGLAYDEDRNPLSRFIILIATWLTFLLSCEVIVISRNNHERARKLPFCAKKIHLIHNGFSPIAELLTREEARGRLGLPPNALILGTTAELTKNKGLRYLVQAGGALNKRGFNFLIYIIGSGEELNNLKTLAAKENISEKIRFSGFIPDAYLYLRAFDIFVFPSLKEGLPYALMEASFAQLPIVASDIGGNEDIVENDKTGFLVPPKNASALAEAVFKLAADEKLREKFGLNAKQKILKEFTIQEMLEKTIALYSWRAASNYE
ncbi:MAG: glycosyltransferase family 4 protein [Candidatus Niyogibacteria bacterium]|nr:MAG: glycosyltransferase family 4 protein [Candidatus Niyogibacteria bacterium]